MGKKEKKIIEELSLIRNIIKYIVVDDSRVVEKGSKQSRLEEEIEKSKIKSNDNLEFLEEVLSELNRKKGKDDFSIDIKKEKKRVEDAHSFVIKYQENEKEEKLTFEREEAGQKYSFEILKEKEVIEKEPYQLDIIYERNKTEEKLKVKYNLRDYPTERERALQDFTGRVDKTLHIFPKSVMGGVLGFTYLGENYMGRREDLSGSKALMVDVHEAIHTNNEYETRVLTNWILTRERPKYKR